MRAAFAAFAVLLASVTQARADVWSDSYDPAAKTRFIPVELWTGGKWDGARTINLPETKFTFAVNKRITGPHDWIDPLTGTTHKVYQREHIKERKVQVFMVREDGTGIGRVWDSRYPNQAMRGESKFPTGVWKEGESRTYKIDNYNREKKTLIPNFESSVTLIMEQINHSFAGTANCMTFRWQLTSRGQLRDNNAYTYCPGKGLASLDDD